MAPAGQRVFALVPTTLVSATGSKPPMTSKAAKKAYAKANQGQKLSRAEQRRRDAEELERQRKEIAKESAARRAKAAREKKLNKEEQARLERRRNGEPEKSKWVRPSQPSIARFVRGNAGKRKFGDDEDDSEELADGKHFANGERPPKRLAVEEDQDQDVEQLEEMSEKDVEADHTETTRNKPSHGQHVELLAESEDEFGDFPILSQPGLLEEIISSIMNSSPPVLRRPLQRNSESESGAKGTPKEVSSPELPTHRKRFEDDVLFGDEDDADLVSAQLRSEEAEAAAKSDTVRPRHEPVIIVPAVVADLSSHDTSTRDKLEDVPIDNHARKSPTTRPIEASRSPKFKIPPLPSIRRHASFSRSMANCAPPSTQAFLEDNIDQFMPSPSQEARELLEDGDQEDSQPHSKVEMDPAQNNSRTVTAIPGIAEEKFDDLICTQDFILSSQDLLEISPIKPKQPTISATRKIAPPKQPLTSMPPPVFKNSPLPIPKNAMGREQVVPKPVLSNIPQQTDPLCNVTMDDFPCTQEFALSPSDLEELNTPSKVAPVAPSTTKNNLASEMKHLLGQQQRNAPTVSVSPKQTASTPQELPNKSNKITHAPKRQSKAPIQMNHQPTNSLETLKQSLRAALAEKSQHPNISLPKPLSSSNHSLTKSSPHDIKHPSSNHTKPESNSKPKPKSQPSKPRFFEEKENDLFAAALHESKIMAEKEKELYLPYDASSHSRKTSDGSSRPGSRAGLRSRQSSTIASAVVAAPGSTTNIASGVPESKNMQKEKSSSHERVGNNKSVQGTTSFSVSRDTTGSKPQQQDVRMQRQQHPKQQPKRTLQRVQSAVTDYGDDDFEGLCEEDFDLLV